MTIQRPDLTGRTALITGAARRIGRHLAGALAAAGVRTVIHANRSRQEGETLAAEIAAAGGRAELVGGDLTDPAVAENLIATAARAFGPLDILVNNASLFAPGDPLETTFAEWRRFQAIHADAPFLLSREFAKQAPAGRDAVIVNLNDWRAGRPGADHFAYTLSKLALHGLTQSLALAFGPRGIRVNELALGAVLPPAGEEAGYLRTLREEIPTRRFPTLADVAAALLFLVSTPSINGETIHVDGGRHGA
ncbi:MAG TPA: SDR family oxidoreductase [Candidatus Krumholzibacteria bacterium]|nr:SDR family oxidoreductase [Candidatus Krumholzibacteria bacterium]HPD70536.1 SDR family oxidoreductase [Candidatus Krumholzibacteria bacterium]HRY39764.1 SDR family oxidoreductase [Candidatus Krumholzibacteria bacterium]